MSNSDLHTTALATGGTNFDIATCIGGKCEYPLMESGNNAKVYYHNMICTQNKYERLAFNTTLETFDATTAPDGSKPARSPFDDDANAYYVGDFSLNPLGNGLVGFQRVYATVPEEHIEPYGLFSRILPSYTTSALGILGTSCNSLSLEEQYSVDGSTWVTRATASLGDNTVIGTTTDNDTGVTVNNATLDWTDYGFVRLKYTIDLETNVTVVAGTNLVPKGTYTERKITLSHWTTTYNEGFGEVGVFLKCKAYDSRHTSADNFYDYAVDLGQLTIDSVTDNANDKTIVAYTAPFNISNYHSETYYKDFGGVELCRRCFKKLQTSYTTVRTDIILDPPTSNEQMTIPSFTRGNAEEENCPAHIVYTYIRTDNPEEITLQSKTNFPASLSTTTDPTTNQYIASVASGEYFNAENQFIERYMGNIYRLGQIRSTLK